MATCSVCGKKIGFFYIKRNMQQLYCANCFQQARNNAIVAGQQARNHVSYYFGGFTFSDPCQCLTWNNMFSFGTYPYSSIMNYRPISDITLERKRHGVTRAVAGDLLFGPVGGVVGALTGGKNYQYSNKLAIVIGFNDGNYIEIPCLRSKQKTDSLLYKAALKTFNEICTRLDVIIKANQQAQNEQKQKQENDDSDLDELLKLKRLLDAGAINQEEYDIKKKQILGI